MALDSLDMIESVANRLGIGNRYRSRIENEMNLMLIVTGNHEHNTIKNTWQVCLQEYTRNPGEYINIYNLMCSAHNYGASLLTQNRFEEARKVMIQATEAEGKARKNGIIQNDRATYELLFRLRRDTGRAYILEEPVSDKKRESNAREAHSMFRSVRQLFEDYPFDIDNNAYVRFTLPWVSIYTGDTYAYTENHNKAATLYLQAYSEARDIEEILGDNALTVDFPVILLEIYTTCLQKLSLYYNEEINTYIGTETEFLLKKYSKINFTAEHASKATQYLQSLRTISELLKTAE